MTVIRRLDIVLEPTKEKVLQTKKMLDANKVVNQTEALCMAAGHPFCNSSPFCLKDLTSRAKKQTLKADFIAYLDGFSPNVQEILDSMTLYELRFKDCRGAVTPQMIVYQTDFGFDLGAIFISVWTNPK